MCTNCPSEAELTAFNLGDLPTGAVDAVAEHLEVCPRCAQLLHRLEHDADDFISSLRNLAGPPLPPGPAGVGETPRQVGDYDILGELGRGGMGLVLKARDRRLDRVVALKMLLAGEFAEEEFRARFRAEAGMVARLQHPAIVQILDIGEWRPGAGGPPVPHFTLEYVDGGSLSTRLAGKPQPPRQAAEWLRTLAGAVHYAHGQGIIHRDLKPSNVLLSTDGQLKLCDFGVAKPLTGSDLKTQSGLLVGTPEYMAPEQARGQAAGPAADIHALGAMLYTMLTGRPPFQGASVSDTLDQVRAQEPVGPRRLQPGVPRDLETICLKCLHKDVRRRYADAGALAADLERFLAGRPIQARPTGVVERAWKWARRRPAVALLSAAVLLVTVLGAALVTWRWRAEIAAKERANEKSAELALDRALTLCEQGEMRHGLTILAHDLDLALQPGARQRLERAFRINLADWQGQLSPRLRHLSWRHSAEVLHLVFSPDGRTLASAGKDRFVRFWDTATGQQLLPPLVHDRPLLEDCWVGRVTFHPTDPNILLAGDGQGRAIFWDVSRRQRVGAPLEHPRGHMIWGAAFTPDGRTLVTMCDDGAARRWDVADRRLIGEPLWHTHEPVGYYTLALSADGKTLVTGGIDGRVVRWDFARGTRLGSPSVHDSPVEALAVSRDAQKIVIGTQHGTLHVWQPETGRVDLPPQGEAVKSLALSPDGRTLVTGTLAANGGLLRFWNLTTFRQPGQTYKLRPGVRALAFHPDGRTLAVGHLDGTIHLWKLPQDKAIGPPLHLKGPVHSLTFDRSDGTRLLAGTPWGAQWWDLERRQPQGPLMHRTRYEPEQTVLSADRRRTYQKMNQVEATALSPDGRLVALAGWSGAEGRPTGRLELWDAVAGDRLPQMIERPKPLTGVIFSPNSAQVLTWGADAGSAELLDAADLRTGRPVLRSLNTSINQAVFSADGKTLLVACTDKTARAWDVARDEEINPGRHPEHAYAITAVTLDPSRARVVTGCYAGTVRTWDATTGTLLNDVRGNAGEITAIAVSSDGTMLVTASHDRTARFWDVASGRQLGPTLYHTNAVLCVAFHPDGQSIVTGTSDGMIHRWHLPAPPQEGSPEQIRQLIQEQSRLWRDERGLLHTLRDD